MAKYEFITQETGIPCSDEFNESVSKMFDNHPALDELLHIDPYLMYLMAEDIASGKLTDWDSREELIARLSEWDYPDLKPRIKRAIMQLRQNTGKA